MTTFTITASDAGLHGDVLAIDPEDENHGTHFYMRVDQVAGWTYTPEQQVVQIRTLDGTTWVVRSSAHTAESHPAFTIDEMLFNWFVGIPTRSQAEGDADALDKVATIIRKPEWSFVDDMPAIAQLVRTTGRDVEESDHGRRDRPPPACERGDGHRHPGHAPPDRRLGPRRADPDSVHGHLVSRPPQRGGLDAMAHALDHADIKHTVDQVGGGIQVVTVQLRGGARLVIQDGADVGHPPGWLAERYPTAEAPEGETLIAGATDTTAVVRAVIAELVIDRYDEVVRANTTRDYDAIHAVAYDDDGFFGVHGEVLDIASRMGRYLDGGGMADDPLFRATDRYQARLRAEVKAR